MKKYEQEIRELLEKIEKDNFVGDGKDGKRPENANPNENRYRNAPPPRPIRPKQKNTARVGNWMNTHGVYRAGMYMIIGYSVVIAGLTFREFSGGNTSSLFWLVQLIVGIGGLLFLAPAVIRFFTGRSVDNQPKMWRGEFVNDEPAFTWQKVKGWFGGNRNNRGGGGGGYNNNNRFR
jgi:hypothetical protein